jgi:trimeric autotransporter adhesin
MKRIQKHLTYANVASTLTLFLALGGATAYAVDQLPSKSVGAAQLRPGAVTADKIRKHAVTAPKIEAEAIKSGKLAAGAVKEAKLANASVTNQKLADGAVSTGKIGADAVTGAQVSESTLSQVPSAAAANTATFAESANPVAFAAVDQEGGVDTSLSKGQISVTQGKEAGIYCVSVAGFSPRGAQVTPRYNGSGSLTAYVTIGGTGSCPAPQVEVQTHNGGLVKAPFYIVLYR